VAIIRGPLNAIGFIWDPHEHAWEKGFTALTKFKAREGHCRVPQFHKLGGYKLGQWVAEQRHREANLSPMHKKRLDAIGFIWDPHEHAWEKGFTALTKFKAREGHCRVPQFFVTRTYKLGQWVWVQRVGADTLPPKRKKRLNAIGFVWDPHEYAWEKGFAALAKFKAREGHCRVPQSHIEGTYRLGQWVANQRAKVSAERRKRLNAIGFVWDPYEHAWETGFTALVKFKAREGHCGVPTSHIEGKYKLGQWVIRQRDKTTGNTKDG
jgi:Helicase associated domain